MTLGGLVLLIWLVTGIGIPLALFLKHDDDY